MAEVRRSGSGSVPTSTGQATWYAGVVLTAWLPSILCATFAAFRTRGALRFMLASSGAMDLLFWWLHEAAPAWYATLWPYSAAWAIGCAGAVVLGVCHPRWWVALPALMVHCWAGHYPDRWPGHWLQAQLHTVAFMFLLFGLALLVECTRTCKDRLHVAIISALFIGTAFAYYPEPWAAWIRPWLMWWQSSCYLALAASKKPHKPSGPVGL